jgi:hypothetical protein
MKMHKDFEIMETTFGYKTADDLFGVKLLTGEFAGVEYTYGTINFPDALSDGADEFSISFDYDIRSAEDNISKTEDVRLRFERTIGEVLNTVLVESITAAEKKYNDEKT